MSIEIMTRVWKQSKQGGSQLLLLLAIADNANDGGFAWPGQKYLADKIRMNKKSIPRLTKKLQEAGELFIHNRAEAGKVTQYIVTVGMGWDQLEETLKRYLKFDKVQLAFTKRGYMKILGGDKLGGGQVGGGTQLCPGGVDIAVSRGVDIAVSTEPSLTVNETPFLETPLSPEKKSDLNTLAHYVAEIKTDDITTKDELRAVTLLSYEVAQVCKLDVSLAGTPNLKAIARITLALKAKGVKIADLKLFSDWWYNEPWQGKNGQAPSPAQLGDMWGQFEAQKVINVPITVEKGFYV